MIKKHYIHVKENMPEEHLNIDAYMVPSLINVKRSSLLR